MKRSQMFLLLGLGAAALILIGRSSQAGAAGGGAGAGAGSPFGTGPFNTGAGGFPVNMSPAQWGGGSPAQWFGTPQNYMPINYGSPIGTPTPAMLGSPTPQGI